MLRILLTLALHQTTEALPDGRNLLIQHPLFPDEPLPIEPLALGIRFGFGNQTIQHENIIPEAAIPRHKIQT